MTVLDGNRNVTRGRDRPSPTPDGTAWGRILRARSAGESLDPTEAGPFAPLTGGDGPLVVGQLGQSLDGRIATPTGESKYINGPGGLEHLHRLRALVDAVVVGASTAVADDPGLDVRFVEGPSPARVVIDPRGRVPAGLRLFRADGARRVVVVGAGCRPCLPAEVEVVPVRVGPSGMAAADVVAALARIGFGRLLIEGGAQTVSRFLQAGSLDRLHVIVAPFLIGAGPAGISMPTLHLADGLRPPAEVWRLGDDVLFDCDMARATRGPAAVG